MSAFREELEACNPDPGGDRRWVYVPYDQLTDRWGWLSREDPEDLGIVLVESPAKAGRRPYHKQKLALVLANTRHFALEQAARGVAVDWRVHEEGFAPALREAAADHGRLVAMTPAERELRAELAPLVADGCLELHPHEGWITDPDDFAELGEPPWRMDVFYRGVRQRTGILMEDGKPVGGRYSFDGDNRESWSGDPPAPQPPTFEQDAITAEVIELVTERFGDHPGRLRPEHLPSTHDDAQALWAWAKSQCMPCFGPFEDAMSTESRTLFHTRISPLLNLGRLQAARVVDDVLALDIPLQSKEGFVRQVIGWREFVRHVHEVTDGFRQLPEGYEHQHLGAGDDLPDALWEGTSSGLACLDEVVDGVWEEAYSHHITRLMVLSNLGTLLDWSPRALTDWFWVAYADAYDWVVEPNVLGMGTFSLGPLFTTKPYVSGANYIHKMSDYCASCPFHPKKTCPITPLYWAFLGRHHDRLRPLRRMKLPLASQRKRSEDQQAADAAVFEHVRDRLAAGETVTPDSVSEARDGSAG